MSSLESVQPSLEDYLQSFESAYSGIPPNNSNVGQGWNMGDGQNDPLRDIGMSVTSSDAFLHGVLTGQWMGSQPLVPTSQYPPSLDFSHQHIATHAHPPLGPYEYGSVEGSIHPGTASFRPSPGSPSDGVLSSAGSPGPRVSLDVPSVQYPPSISYQHPVPTLDAGEDSQASFMWDNFLRELGIQ